MLSMAGVKPAGFQSSKTVRWFPETSRVSTPRAPVWPGCVVAVPPDAVATPAWKAFDWLRRQVASILTWEAKSDKSISSGAADRHRRQTRGRRESLPQGGDHTAPSDSM